MFFQIDPKKNIPLYEQIVFQVKELCAKRILKPDDKLPSVRELSSMMVINPNTVSKAYQELERQGVIVTIRGRGTFIADHTPGGTADPAMEAKILEQLKQAVIDSHYAGIGKEELLKRLSTLYDELEGESHGN